MLLYYIRHGDPIYDPDSLTPLGHKQAAALADRLCLYGFDEIYSSTSTRAIMTAEPTCKRLGKTPILLDWAHEARAWDNFATKKEDGNYSWVFQQNSWVEKLNDPTLTALGDQWYEHPHCEGTNLKKGVLTTNENADKFLETLGFRHDRANHRFEVLRTGEKRVALFAHAGFGMAFLSSVMDIPYAHFATHFDMSHSCVTVIGFAEDTKYVYPKILQLSNDSHLFKAGLMEGYNGQLKI